MTMAIGLREMKKERTRTDIVRVAMELFARQGFDDVTVDQIAAEAEVSHRTFYRYFATKEELILGPLQQALDDLTDSFARRPRTEPVIVSIREAVLELAANYEDSLDRDLQRAAVFRATPSLQARQNERRAAFEGVTIPLIAERLGVDPKPDFGPALSAWCAVAAMRVATTQWLLADGSGLLLPIVEQALSMLAPAFDDVT